MTRIQKREIINSFPLDALYPLQGSRIGSRAGTSRLFVCPLCGSGTGRHRTGALSITATGRVACFACGGFSDSRHKTSDTLAALEIILKTDENGAFDYCRERLEGCPLPDPNKGGAVTFSGEKPDFTDFYRETQKALFLSQAGLEYLQRRAITMEAMKAFHLGYCDSWKHSKAGESVRPSRRIIIPRTLKTYLARRIDEPATEWERPYSKQVEGTQRAFFHGMDLKAPVAFIAEGELDAISLWEAGAPGVVAIGSVANASTLLERANAQSIYILAFDNDGPGRAGQKALYRRMMAQGLKAISPNTAQLYGGAKDPNEGLIKNPDALKKGVCYLIKKALEAFR